MKKVYIELSENCEAISLYEVLENDTHSLIRKLNIGKTNIFNDLCYYLSGIFGADCVEKFIYDENMRIYNQNIIKNLCTCFEYYYVFGNLKEGDK